MSTSSLKFGLNKRQKQQQTPVDELAAAKYTAEMSKAWLQIVQLKQDLHDAHKRVERLSSRAYARVLPAAGEARGIMVSEALIDKLTTVYGGDDRFIESLMGLVERSAGTSFQRAYADMTHGIKWAGRDDRAWSMLLLMCNLIPLDSAVSIAIDDIAQFYKQVERKTDEQWDDKCDALLVALNKAYVSVPEEIVDDDDVDDTCCVVDDSRRATVSQPFNVTGPGSAVFGR